MVSPLFGGICGGGVGISTSETIRLKRLCMSPHVGPEVAGLVEALPTLHADEVSWPGLCPERPSVLQRRAVGTPALVEGSEVLWNVRLKDIEDVQALLVALGRRLWLDGVQDGLGLQDCVPSGARPTAGQRTQLLTGLGGGLSGR